MARAVDFYYAVYRFCIVTDEQEIPAYEAVSMPNRQFVIYAGKRKDATSLYEKLCRQHHIQVQLMDRDRSVSATLHVRFEDVEELPLLVNATASRPITKAGKEGDALDDIMQVALEGVCLYGCKYEFVKEPKEES